MPYYLALRPPGRRRRFLGQADILTSPSGAYDPALVADPSASIASGELPTAADVSAFSSWYAQYQAAWSDFLTMDAAIQDHLARWTQVAADASRAGDTATENTAAQRIAWLQLAKTTRDEVQAVVEKFGTTWESVRGYVSNAGRWFGLGDLGVLPLVLPVAIVAAIAALAYVVTKIVELRQGLNYDAQLLAAAEAGKITGATAAALSAAAHGGAGGPSLGTWLVLGAGAVVALSWGGVLGGRGRA